MLIIKSMKVWASPCGSIVGKPGLITLLENVISFGLPMMVWDRICVSRDPTKSQTDDKLHH